VLKTSAKDAPSAVSDWTKKKGETVELIKLLQAYKDLGDSKGEAYLKYHNPRTFEDLSAPVPNFRAMNLKAGEVPKFFDGVLSSRADKTIDQKNKWWADRKKAAEASAAAAGEVDLSKVELPPEVAAVVEGEVDPAAPAAAAAKKRPSRAKKPAVKAE